MADTHGMKRLHRRHTGSGRVAEKNAVFYMAAEDTSRFQHAQKVRGQIVHLLKELLRIFVVTEVVIAWCVLIVI